jgi:hypothetical protein
VRGFDKAAAQWEKGTRAIVSGSSWLVESRTTLNEVYRVRREGGVLGCNCKAGLAGRTCWHMCFVAAIEDGSDFIPVRTQEPTPKAVSYEEAMAAISELFA